MTDLQKKLNDAALQFSGAARLFEDYFESYTISRLAEIRDHWVKGDDDPMPYVVTELHHIMQMNKNQQGAEYHRYRVASKLMNDVLRYWEIPAKWEAENNG